MKHLSEYAYSEEDDEFYDRALTNYPDHPDRRRVEPTTWAGPVTIPKGDGITVTRPAYTEKEVRAIEQQGRDRPRPLTHEETERASHNRGRARGDLAAMERWYRAEVKEPIRSRRRLERARGGPVDETLTGIELGADIWQPVEW